MKINTESAKNGDVAESGEVQGAHNVVTGRWDEATSDFSAIRSCTSRRGIDEKYSAAIERIVRADKSKNPKAIIEIFLAVFEIRS